MTMTLIQCQKLTPLYVPTKDSIGLITLQLQSEKCFPVVKFVLASPWLRELIDAVVCAL